MTEGLIQAISRTVKTMADGTLRLTIDIEPNDAQDAFMLFGQPGAPVVLARLTQEAAQAALQEQAAATDGNGRQAAETAGTEQKGGELAKWAGILCADKYFYAWVVDTYSYLYMIAGMGSMEDKSKRFIYEKCCITSRRELDHNKQAGLIFREEIMAPFHQWRAQQ